MEQKPFALAEYDIDYDLYKKFHRFHTRLNSSMMGYIVPPLGFMASMAMGFTFGFDGLTLAVLAICLFLVISKISAFFWTPKLVFAKSRDVYTASHRMRLFEQAFENEVEGPAARQAVTQYTELWQAFETNDMFFLYLTSQQVYLLPKKALSPEASIKLRLILTKRLNKKFHNLSKSW